MAISWVSMKADVLLLIFLVHVQQKEVKPLVWENILFSQIPSEKCNHSQIPVKSVWRRWKLNHDWLISFHNYVERWNVVNITMVSCKKKLETKENKIEISLFVTWSYPWYAWYAGTQGGVVNNRMVSSPKIK